MALNLSPPRKLDGSQPDATGGRGFVDKDNKTRLGRAATRIEDALVLAMRTVERFADDNFAFNRIPLKPEEEAELFKTMSESDLEQAAGIFGVDRILAARKKTAAHLAEGVTPEPLNLIKDATL